MFMMSSITMSDTTVSRILFDSQTTMPLFYPLRYSIDHLNNKSISTQDASLQAMTPAVKSVQLNLGDFNYAA